MIETQSQLHASCVMIRGEGVLIRGPSGSGKSTLAWQLVTAENAAGREAWLVADDRVTVTIDRGGQALIASAPEALRGLIELRGIGIVRRDFRDAARLGLVVDLVGELPERLPPASARVTQILDVTVPRLAAPRDMALMLTLARIDPALQILPDDTAL